MGTSVRRTKQQPATKRAPAKATAKKAPTKKAPAKRAAPKPRSKPAAAPDVDEHPVVEPIGGPCLRAVAGLLAEMGELTGRRAVLAQTSRYLATHLDSGAGLSTAAVHRELRATLAELAPDLQGEGDDDDDLSDPTPVGHTA